MNAADLLHWLMRTTLEASLLIVAVLGLRLMLGTRLSPAWRIGLWMLVGLKLMLPAFIPVGFGLGSLWKDPSDRSDTRKIAISASAFHQAAFSPSVPAIAAQPVIHQSSFGFRHSVLVVWLTGAVLVLLAACRRQRRFDRALRRRAGAALVQSARVVRRLALSGGPRTALRCRCSSFAFAHRAALLQAHAVAYS